MAMTYYDKAQKTKHLEGMRDLAERIIDLCKDSRLLRERADSRGYLTTNVLDLSDADFADTGWVGLTPAKAVEFLTMQTNLETWYQANKSAIENLTL